MRGKCLQLLNESAMININTHTYVLLAVHCSPPTFPNTHTHSLLVSFTATYRTYMKTYHLKVVIDVFDCMDSCG